MDVLLGSTWGDRPPSERNITILWGLLCFTAMQTSGSKEEKTRSLWGFPSLSTCLSISEIVCNVAPTILSISSFGVFSMLSGVVILISMSNATCDGTCSKTSSRVGNSSSFSTSHTDKLFSDAAAGVSFLCCRIKNPHLGLPPSASDRLLGLAPSQLAPSDGTSPNIGHGKFAVLVTSSSLSPAREPNSEQEHEFIGAAFLK